MSSFLDSSQVEEIRQIMADNSDTWAFPITIIKTVFATGAYATDPSTQEFELTAIREYKTGSSDTEDRFRNDKGVEGQQEVALYVPWQKAKDAGLINLDNKILLDQNDLVKMEGEIYQIEAFGGLADMTNEPALIQILARRRFASPNGVDTP